MTTTIPAAPLAPPTPAETPSYGRAYQLKQAAKYRDRANNHWKIRVDLAFSLADRYALPRLGDRRPEDIRVLDIGCSIGTFAIEFAKRSYTSLGIDLDAEALQIAQQLAGEEGVSPTFIQSDLGGWDGAGADQSIDIAVAFDIFEHLHDDQMGSLLAATRRHLSPAGSLVFHTFPTEFEYLFYEHDGRNAEPLIPYASCPPGEFERRTRALAARLDAETIERGELPYRDAIRLEHHCNPTGLRRLRFLFERAGFELAFIESANIYPFFAPLIARFPDQPMAHRNLYGVAVPR